MVANIALDIIGLTFQPGHLLGQKVKLLAFLANVAHSRLFEKVRTFFDLVRVLLKVFKRGSVK
jgi:hypothetical protein